MNLRQAKRELQANILAGNAVVVQGPPGFGKTDFGIQQAKWFRAQHPNKRVGFSCTFMATQTPIGWTGLPWKENVTYNDKAWTITKPAIPDWFMARDMDTGQRLPASEFDLVFFIIEEWGQGSPETKRAGAEVLRAGGTGEYYLPPGSPRIAFSNTDVRDGVTKEFDFIIGRRCQIEITGDIDVWIEDFADKPYEWQGRIWNVMPVTKVWAKNNDSIVFEPKPEKQGPWCNPRSLTAADRYVQVRAEMNNGVIPVNDPGLTETIAGHIGMAATAKFVSDLQFAIQLPSYETVVSDPMGTPVPSKADLQMMMAYTLAGRAKKEHLAEVITYMTKNTTPRMPQDMSITFISSLLRRDYNSFINEPPMQAWIAKNAALVSIIASLSQ